MYIINLIPLHVLVLMLLGRCDLKVYVAYTTFIALGFILSMQVINCIALFYSHVKIYLDPLCRVPACTNV